MVPAFIILLTEITEIEKKYFMLRNNNFQPFYIKTNTIVPINNASPVVNTENLPSLPDRQN